MFTLRKKPLALALAALLSGNQLRAEDSATTVLHKVDVVAGAESDYKADTASSGAKIEQPLRDIPQSIAVVKEELIRSQNAFSLRDALKNVSGLTIAAGEGGRTGDSITLRGFAANSDTFLDGARDNGQYFRDTFFIERAEVLKGASSVLFGRGATGGVINQVSKQPDGEARAASDFTYGAYDFWRITLDAGAAVNDKVAARVTTLLQDGNSFRDYNFVERRGIAPAVKLSFTPDSDATFLYLHQQEDSVFDYGVPMLNGRPAAVDSRQFYGFPDDRLQTFDVNVATAVFNQRFSDAVSLRNTTRYGDYERTYRTLLLGAVTGNGPTANVARSQALRRSTQRTALNQTDFIVERPLLGLRNTLMFGAELGAEDYTFKSKDSTGVGSIAIFAPVLAASVGAGRANDLSGALTTDRDTDANTYAGYVIDQLYMTSHWQLQAGIRYDVFAAEQDDFINNANDLRHTDRQWSPRLGLVWQPDKAQSYYLSYGTSFNPSAESLSLTATTAQLPPEKNRNLEAGAKFDLFASRVSVTTAVFRLEKTNARTAAPTDPTLTVLAGTQRTDGIELGLSGEVMPQWNLSATYAYLDATVVNSNSAATGTVSGAVKSLQGMTAVNVPQHSGTVWSSYHLNTTWEVGGGVFFASQRFTDSVNEVELPGYARADAVVAYHRKHCDLQLNVFNLFDKQYYESGQTRSALPGVPLSAQLTLKVSL